MCVSVTCSFWEDIFLIVSCIGNVASWAVLPNHKDRIAISGYAHTQFSAAFPHHLSKMT